jgi:hypothetical protein
MISMADLGLPVGKDIRSKSGLDREAGPDPRIERAASPWDGRPVKGGNAVYDDTMNIGPHRECLRNCLAYESHFPLEWEST